MTYYCVVHRDEDQQALMGQPLDSCTNHMVYECGYDIQVMRQRMSDTPWKVVWVMERDTKAKYGYRFKELLGIPA